MEQTETRFTLTELPYFDTIQQHTFSSYPQAQDQPFKLMWIPQLEYPVIGPGGDYTTNSIFTMKVLADLIARYGGENAKLIDVQIIPYSPIDGMGSWFDNQQEKFTLPSAYVKDNILYNGMIVPFFAVNYASYSRHINVPISITDYKLQDKYKYVFTSPSGANSWEFSVSKNGGLIDVWVYVDLRPYASYHQIKPFFSGLYGVNETDTRGLIWQEDSSITQVTSAWETYKRQNINYLNSFNSDIEYSKSTLHLTHDTNKGNFAFDSSKHMIEAGVEAAKFMGDQVADDVWFGAKGAIAGGAGAAAIIGGQAGMNAIEGAQMLYNNAQDVKRLELDIGYKKQQFNYSLDNIRALPQNTSKVSGIFASNNFVPYIQVYGPTAEELQYFSSYLDEFGVACGMMVNLGQYASELYYLQGTLVRYSGEITNEEYTTINRALTLGVRKYQEEV